MDRILTENRSVMKKMTVSTSLMTSADDPDPLQRSNFTAITAGLAVKWRLFEYFGGKVAVIGGKNIANYNQNHYFLKIL